MRACVSLSLSPSSATTARAARDHPLLPLPPSHTWLVPFRSMVGDAPLHRPLIPSSRRMVDAAWTGPRYFSWDLSKPRCCWSLIFVVSKGVTMTSASVTPAQSPASMRRPSDRRPSLSRKAVE